MMNLTDMNVTNWAQIPSALDVGSYHVFGLVLVIVFFIVPLSVLVYRSKAEDAISVSLFSSLIAASILVSVDSLNPVAIPVLLALLGLSIGYSFLRK